MLSGRVRLQHEASLLHANAVSSPPVLRSFPAPPPPPHLLLSLLLLHCLSNHLHRPSLKKQKTSTPLASVSVVVRVRRWHAERCEYPVLMLSLARRVRGRVREGSEGRRVETAGLPPCCKQPASFCHGSSTFWMAFQNFRAPCFLRYCLMSRLVRRPEILPPFCNLAQM